MSRVRGWGTVLVVAALTVVAVVAIVLTGRYVADLGAQREAAAQAADDVTVVADALRERQVAAALAASAHQAGGALPPGIVTGAETPTRVVARDSGLPVLDDVDGGLVVVAVYETKSPPRTVQGRRDRVVGYLTTPLDIYDTLAGLASPDERITVEGPENRVMSVPPGRAADGVSHTVSFQPEGASAWTLTVSGPAGRTPALVWVLALVIFLTGAAAAGWIGVRRRAAQRRQAELNGLQKTNAAVAAIAVVVQQSLDLGAVLPALTTELASTLGLRGLSLTTTAANPDRPLFMWGAVPDEGRPALGLTEVVAGQTVWLRLSRGGRSAGRLSVVAGRDLDSYDVGTLVAAGDLTASALANSEAFSQQQSLVDRMQAVDELKSVFLATASHELRTPVVAIAGYASVLNANWDMLGAERARSLIDRVDRNAQRLSRMVEDLLDFSRLERINPLSEDYVVLDLGEVVGQVLGEQLDLAPEHGVTYLPMSGVSIRGSRQALERVVTNLIGNAAKYSPAGTEIRVLVHRHGDEAELVVEDDGPGVSAAERERIFSRFYRGGGDEVTRTRGTGLGLAIVTEFAASMGGAVRADESTTGGARFVVTFPLTPPTPSHLHSPPEPVHATTPGAHHDHT